MCFDDHEPPHLHAVYRGAEARFTINPIGLMDGNLPPRAVALEVEWAARHQSELLENWRRLRTDELPNKVAPLE